MMGPTQVLSPPLRILCAEDDIDLLTMTAEMLRSRGHTVSCATDGEQALTTVARDCEAFDLLITDFRMPCLDGLGLVEQSRRAGYRGKVIIFASALSDANRGHFADLAVDAMIEKPSKHQELVAAVEKLQGDICSQIKGATAAGGSYLA